MGVKLDINLSGVTDKLSAANRAKGQYAMGLQMLSDMNQFVPYKKGPLRTSGHLSGDASELLYDTPYGKKQFYAPGSWKYSTPGTGPRWDLKAKPIHLNDWKRAYMEGARW